MATRWMLAGAVLGAAAVAAFFVLQGSDPTQTTPAPVAQQAAQAPAHARAHAARKDPARLPANAAAPVRPSQWDEFERKFGPGLVPEFSAEGRLVSIHGTGLQAASFDVRDPQSAIARAREILDAAHDLLGLRTELPLDSPRAMTSLASAQVSFHEQLEGTPVAPFGDVTVALGAHGELTGLDSSYVPNLTAQNTPLRSADELKTQALAAARADGAHVDGGSKVVWASTSLATSGVYAYQYWVRGRQIVIDASSGEVLFSRDRRSF